MKVSEVLQRVKNGENMTAIADDIGLSRSGLTKKMNKIGFVFDRAVKEYTLAGDNQIDVAILDFDLNDSIGLLKKRMEGASRNSEDDSRNTEKEPRKKVEEETEKIDSIHEDVPIIREREDNVLTTEEIMFLKELYLQYKRDGGMFRKIFLDTYAELPNRKPSIKTPYMISKTTADEFDDFANGLVDEFRVTRNDLVEMAMRYFVQEFRPLLENEDCSSK